MQPMKEPVSYEQPDPRTVRIGWKGGDVRTYAARDLRLACPCASCIDEYSGRPLLDPAKVPADVAVVGCELVGRYAFNFAFSDQHRTGIYTFAWLAEHGTPVEG